MGDDFTDIGRTAGDIVDSTAKWIMGAIIVAAILLLIGGIAAGAYLFQAIS